MKNSFLVLYFIFCSILFAQWELKVDGMHNWNRANPLSFGTDGSIGIWVVATTFPRPLSISTDSANSWQHYNTPDSWGGNDLYVYDSDRIWFCTNDGEIYHSSDGGTNWILQYEDTINHSFFNFIKFFDAQNGIVLGDAPFNSGKPAPVLKTTDGGNSWLNINENSLIDEYSRDQFHPISFPNVEVGYFYGSGDHQLYKTVDGGSNWEIVSLPDEITNVFMLKFYDENIGMFVADNGLDTDYIYRTTDGSQSWQKLNLESNTVHHDIEFLPGNPNSVWFTDYDHLYFSANMGDAWQEVNLGVENIEARNIEFFDDQIGAILCDHNKFFYTKNNGGMIVSVDKDENLVKEYKLYQNYPNPFNPSTQIKFAIPQAGVVRLKVYDIIGREVGTLVNDNMSAGIHEVNFNASHLASGVYFYQLTSNGFSQTKKLLLLK